MDDAIRQAIKMAHTFRASAPPAPAAPIGWAAPSMSPADSINWPPPPSDLRRHDDPLTHAAQRRYLRPDRELVPDPPVPVRVRGRRVFSMLVRLPLVVVAATIVAYAFTEIISVRPNRSLPQRAGERVASIAPVSPAFHQPASEPALPSRRVMTNQHADLAVGTRSPDKRLLDSRAVQLDPKTAAIQPLDSEQAAKLLELGRELLRTGDIAAARVAFQRLADAGNVEAALALGKAFDPRFLARHYVIGVVGDEAKARAWYQRAMELGSTEAKGILAQMATK